MRFLAPEILPPEVNRALYLDCDLVVLEDLRPLWTMDMHGKSLAAAPDYPWGRPEVTAKRRTALGLNAGHTYVNSGVLVLDLDRWRRDRISDRLFAYAEQQGAALAFHDQDTINAVLRDDIHLIDCRWNLQARMYLLGWRSFPSEFEATRHARRRPAILHYTTADKPWMFRSGAARKWHYFRYLDETAWRDTRPKLATRLQKMEWGLGQELLSVGIDYMRLLSLTRYVTRPWRFIRRGLVSARGRMLPVSTPK
jgi:lipopolysaccharide biosynthesis glycosyltransferase